MWNYLEKNDNHINYWLLESRTNNLLSLSRQHHRQSLGARSYEDRCANEYRSLNTDVVRLRWVYTPPPHLPPTHTHIQAAETQALSTVEKSPGLRIRRYAQITSAHIRYVKWSTSRTGRRVRRGEGTSKSHSGPFLSAASIVNLLTVILPQSM